MLTWELNLVTSDSERYQGPINNRIQGHSLLSIPTRAVPYGLLQRENVL